MASDDYRDIRSIAVHREDVVTALEANQQGDSGAVLRVTPPFSGRMRARLHVEHTDEYDATPAPIHVPPSRLVADPPTYPTPDATEERLRSDDDIDYTVDRHHERHAAAVASWRESVADAIAESVTLDGAFGSQRVAVTVLG
ncbi:hypothetical protein [Halococcus thailandensis]|uniref:DUF8009 domain-containing protein n=1 Tax=Halococcus thailandensis JCM 13552 TaxID=1227457 RepID=M0N243_9EURY|nr:hypothetical protein [Halococcus thailandensis]EMA51941.1 hypothetical protein C451_13144 [Halococcus thailandensis JCM 13552]